MTDRNTSNTDPAMQVGAAVAPAQSQNQNELCGEPLPNLASTADAEVTAIAAQSNSAAACESCVNQTQETGESAPAYNPAPEAAAAAEPAMADVAVVTTKDDHPLARSKPISEAKLHANQVNSLRSTGAKTARGKRFSSANAVKHGLFANGGLPPGPDAARLEELTTQLVHDLKPVGAREELVVAGVARGFWREERLNRCEFASCVFAQQDRASNPQLSESQRQLARNIFSVPTIEEMNRLARYSATFSRQLERDLRLLQQLQEARLKKEREQQQEPEQLEDGDDQGSED